MDDRPEIATEISQRALEELYGRKLDKKLEWVVLGHRLFHRLDGSTWIEYP